MVSIFFVFFFPFFNRCSTIMDASLLIAVVALIMGKNGEKMDFGYGKTFLEKVSWGGPETPFCGISGPIPACGGVYTEKWTKF